MNSKKQRKIAIITMITMAAVIILGLTIGLVVFFKLDMGKFITNRGSRVYSPAEIEKIESLATENGKQIHIDDIKKQLDSGIGINTLVRNMFADQFVYTVGGRYYFTPINYELKQNKLVNANFVAQDNGEIVYKDNGTITSHKGIDASKYQGTIDFSKVKNSGVEYAMLRVGYRGYTGGTLNKDTSFDTYAKDAIRNGIDVGVYFFSQAITTAEAEEEAEYVLNQISPYNITYPIVIDIEEITEDTARQESLSNEQLTDIVIAFCEKIKSAGYTPMIYANMRYFAGKLQMERLDNYEKWYAFYADVPYMPYEFSMWQYSDSGSIDGINGKVDLDISFKTW